MILGNFLPPFSMNVSTLYWCSCCTNVPRTWPPFEFSTGRWVISPVSWPTQDDCILNTFAVVLSLETNSDCRDLRAELKSQFGHDCLWGSSDWWVLCKGRVVPPTKQQSLVVSCRSHVALFPDSCLWIKERYRMQLNGWKLGLGIHILHFC